MSAGRGMFSFVRGETRIKIQPAMKNNGASGENIAITTAPINKDVLRKLRLLTGNECTPQLSGP